MSEQFSVLVLAARRGGVDSVAALGQCSHKCLTPIYGRAMLARVLDALIHSASVGAIAISIDDAALFEGSPEISAMIEGHDITLIASAATPSLSVTKALDVLAWPWPVLVTTADTPLLTPQIVDYFCAQALTTNADIAVGLASAQVVLARYPDARRSFIRFSDGRYSGCNLFALMMPAARAAVAFWVHLEKDRKHPWRLFMAFGPMALVRFLAGGATLASALAAASSRLGLTAAAVDMPFADAAVDVDKPADMELVEKILKNYAQG